jgi:D-glutamate cyclase
MNEISLDRIRDLIQEDVGNRGLGADPVANLITACRFDFSAACRSIAESPSPALGIVTGFYIPHAEPPCGETDGPLGALFIARALIPLGARILFATDAFCTAALDAGLAACGLTDAVPVITLPSPRESSSLSPKDFARRFLDQVIMRGGNLTHLIALERAGPSHTMASIQSQAGSTPEDWKRFLAEVPSLHYDRYHTMSGRDITAHMSPAHWLFEEIPKMLPIKTIGIGDGGNELGMGKIPWEIIRRNIHGGGLVACRVLVDYLIVCGVSNWGAYGLATGVRGLKGFPPGAELFDSERERELLRIMVEKGPLVDGLSGQPSVTVDGLSFERYAEPLRRLASI